MSTKPQITVIGNLTADPELRFTPGGDAVANFTIASTPRKFDRQANEWRDGEPLYLRCSIWRKYAENVAETLTKGAAVIAMGSLVQQSWEDRETGQKRTAVALEVTEIGPALKFATAQVARNPRDGGGSQGGQQSQGYQQQSQGDVYAGASQGFQPQTGYPADNPWGGQQDPTTPPF